MLGRLKQVERKCDLKACEKKLNLQIHHDNKIMKYS